MPVDIVKEDGTFSSGKLSLTDTARKIIADVNDLLGHMAIDLLNLDLDSTSDEDALHYKAVTEKWNALQEILFN